MKFFLKTGFSVFVIFFLWNCSSYEKVLKSGDYRLKYNEAMKYYSKPDYLRAGAIFDQIAGIYRGTEQADTVYYYQAMCYFKQNDFILSGHYFRMFAQTYAASSFAEDADFNGAFCYYLSSPRVELDQENSVMAIQALQLHLIKYPNSKRADECNGYIIELRNKLVEKAYISAKLYYDLDDYKASMVSLNNCMVQYPESKYREEIMYMLVKSSYLLAYNSIPSKKRERYQESIDEYYSFAAEFPESKYNKEIYKYYKQASKSLGIEIVENKQN